MKACKGNFIISIMQLETCSRKNTIFYTIIKMASKNNSKTVKKDRALLFSNTFKLILIITI